MLHNCENWTYTSFYNTINGNTNMSWGIEFCISPVKTNTIAIRSIAFNAWCEPVGSNVANLNVPGFRGVFNTSPGTPSPSAVGNDASVINKAFGVSGSYPTTDCLIPFSDIAPWYGYVKVSGAPAQVESGATCYGAFLMTAMYNPVLSVNYDVVMCLSIAFEVI